MQIAALNAMCKREGGFGTQVIRGRSKRRRESAPTKTTPVPVMVEELSPMPPSPEPEPVEVGLPSKQSLNGVHAIDTGSKEDSSASSFNLDDNMCQHLQLKAQDVRSLCVAAGDAGSFQPSHKCPNCPSDLVSMRIGGVEWAAWQECCSLRGGQFTLDGCG